MSNAFRFLKAAAHEFVHRPVEDQVDPNQLRDVIEELEGELEFLYETDPAAARAEALAEEKRFIEQLRRRYSESGKRQVSIT